MLMRFLQILSLIAVLVVGGYIWFSDTFTNLFVAHVHVARVINAVPAGQFITSTDFIITEIEKSKISADAIYFEKDDSPKSVISRFQARAAKSDIGRGQYLSDEMFGDITGMITLVTTKHVKRGDEISLKNVETREVRGTFGAGALLFGAKEDALKYLDSRKDLAFSKAIDSGQAITFDSILKGSERVFAIEIVKRIFRNQVLSADSVEIVPVPNEQMEGGLISFPEKKSAQKFVLSIGQFMATRELKAGGYIAADAVIFRNDEALMMSDEMPTTLKELGVFSEKYPDQVILLNKQMLMAGNLEREGKIDLWIEKTRTQTKDSMFGEILFRKVVSEALIHIVGEIDGGDESDAADNKIDHWILVDPDDYKAFNEAWVNKEKIAFAISSDELLSDVIGNGVSCTDNECSVNRMATEDMASTLVRFNPRYDPDSVDASDYLTILESVGTELAAKLREQDIKSLNDVASMTDLQVNQLSIQFHLSKNRLVLIRDQARAIVKAQNIARRKLEK